MKQIALTKSEKMVYSYLNILIKYLKYPSIGAANQLLCLIQESLYPGSEMAQEINGTDDIAQMVKILVSKYPQILEEGFQKELSEAIEDEDMAESLRDVVVDTMSQHFPRYYEKAVDLQDDDKEWAYCSFSFPKAHTFHRRDSFDIRTKVLNFRELDFCVGSDFFSFDEPAAYSTQDYIWIIDAIPTMKMRGEIKYGYGD